MGKKKKKNTSKNVALSGEQSQNNIINSDLFFIGCEISRYFVSVGMSNIVGKCQFFEKISVVDYTPENICAVIIKSVNKFIGSLQKENRIIAIGVSLDAVISADKKNVIKAPVLDWENENFAQAVEYFLHIPCYLFSSTRLMLVAEKFFASLNDKNIIYLNWGDSIRLAFLKDNKIDFLPNSFGHIYVGGIEECSCGLSGCLESECSVLAIRKQCSVLTKPLRQILRNSQYTQIICHKLSTFVSVLMPVVNSTGIKKIILSGQMSLMGDTYYKFFIDEFDKLKNNYTNDVKIVCSPLGEASAVLGSIIGAYFEHCLNKEIDENTILDFDKSKIIL